MYKFIIPAIALAILGAGCTHQNPNTVTARDGTTIERVSLFEEVPCGSFLSFTWHCQVETGSYLLFTMPNGKQTVLEIDETQTEPTLTKAIVVGMRTPVFQAQN